MKKSPWWVLMAAILIAETIFLGFLIFRNVQVLISLILRGTDGSVVALEMSLVVILALGLIWVLATARGAIKKMSWARSSNLTIQVLFAAAGVGVLQGIIGTTWWGFVILLAAILGGIASLMLSMVKKNLED